MIWVSFALLVGSSTSLFHRLPAFLNISFSGQNYQKQRGHKDSRRKECNQPGLSSEGLCDWNTLTNKHALTVTATQIHLHRHKRDFFFFLPLHATLHLSWGVAALYNKKRGKEKKRKTKEGPIVWQTTSQIQQRPTEFTQQMLFMCNILIGKLGWHGFVHFLPLRNPSFLLSVEALCFKLYDKLFFWTHMATALIHLDLFSSLGVASCPATTFHSNFKV